MDLCGLVFTLLVLAVRCGAQFSYYSTVPHGCTLACPPTEGYAVRLGQTLCMCKNDLCRGNNCGERGCVVKRLPFYGDWRTCGPEPSAVPVPVPIPVVNRVENVPTTTGSTSPECSEPKVTGRCRALMIRYYYDPSSGVCKQFAFGGCDGNHNNFNTMEECQRTCMEARPRLPALNFGNSNSGSSNSNSGSSNSNSGSSNRGNSNGQLPLQNPTQVANFLRGLLQRGK